jgi:hypothetical protein
VLLSTRPTRRFDIGDETKAMEPEDVTRLVVQRLDAGDAAGVAALYEPQAVLAYPPIVRRLVGRRFVLCISGWLRRGWVSGRSRASRRSR